MLFIAVGYLDGELKIFKVRWWFTFQDKDDDLKVGVKSTALKFQEQTKLWLSGFTLAMMSGLVVAGVNAEQTLPYYAALTTVAGHLTHQVRI